MVFEINGRNMPHAYDEFIWRFKSESVLEESRNGPVRTVPYPTVLQVNNPRQRIIFAPARDANPFFHCMEFVWMMSGSRSLDWIVQFNKKMLDYSDDGRTLPNSYGVRWRNHWEFDQIPAVVAQLKKDLNSRRAVLAMWDPQFDLEDDPREGKDKPCNTHIYFRVMAGLLHMTVCNRSNDAIWGMFGANAVHMTMLQELMAFEIGIGVGNYWVMTNNLHVYQNLPRHDEIMRKSPENGDYYRTRDLPVYPLLQGHETYKHFVEDCMTFVQYPNAAIFATKWMQEVALPMKRAYLDRVHRNRWIANIAARDWSMACQLWNERR